MLSRLKHSFIEFQKKYETRLDILFFIAGFIFDAFMVSEVDEPIALIQQAVYLFIISVLLHYEILFRTLKWRPEGLTLKYWTYRNLLIHFLLGTLLNIYSLFYIKSSSFINSILFLPKKPNFAPQRCCLPTNRFKAHILRESPTQLVWLFVMH